MWVSPARVAPARRLATKRLAAWRLASSLCASLGKIVICRFARRFAALVRRGLGTAFGYGDERRPQAAVANHIACLHHVDHGTFRHVWVRHLEHGLMAIRVETLADRIDAGDAVALEHVQKLALCDLDPIEKALQRGILGGGFSRNMLDGAPEIRERVLRAAADRGYVPNATVRRAPLTLTTPPGRSVAHSHCSTGPPPDQ